MLINYFILQFRVRSNYHRPFLFIHDYVSHLLSPVLHALSPVDLSLINNHEAAMMYLVVQTAHILPIRGYSRYTHLCSILVHQNHLALVQYRYARVGLIPRLWLIISCTTVVRLMILGHLKLLEGNGSSRCILH